jgi:DNA-directed RNA polymerase subunit RPC12/RpoP
MGWIGSRLRRLEERGRGGNCPECGYAPDDVTRRPIAVVYPDEPEKSFDGDPHERCPHCGQRLYVVITVVREGHEGGGGLT